MRLIYIQEACAYIYYIRDFNCAKMGVGKIWIALSHSVVSTLVVVVLKTGVAFWELALKECISSSFPGFVFFRG